MFNLRGDDGAQTGGLAVDSNLGWKGAEKYVATVPQVFDLWQDPQERYDIFMNNFTERTWMGVVMGEELKKLMETYVQVPAAQAAEHGLYGPDHPLELREVPVGPGAPAEGRHHDPHADRELAVGAAATGGRPGALPFFDARARQRSEEYAR